MSKLPIYDIVLQDDDLKQGVGRISLVDEPAIGVDWIKLKKQEDCTECLEDEGPCYEGYVQVGMKILDGKEVPNCVPVVDGKPEAPTKQLKKQPKSLLAKRECLGCPPNGDGTRANGEPDRRCKGDGGDKGAGKGGAKAPTKVDTIRDDATMRKDLLNYDAENSKDYGQDRRKLDGSKTTQTGAPAVKLNDAEVSKLKDRMNKSVRTPQGNVKVVMSPPGGMSKNSEPFHDGEKLTNAGFVKIRTETYSVRNNNIEVTDEHIGYWNPKTNEIIAKDGPESRGYNTSSKIASIFN